MVAAAIIRIGQLGRPEHDKSVDTAPMTIVTTRAPRSTDAAAVAELVKDAGTLEVNTTYAYLLLCAHFADTSALAESAGEIIGCVLGYRIPDRPDTLFIWQIGVSPVSRRRGIGRRLLDELLRRPALSDVKFLETTVAPSNAASRSLFERWAHEHHVELRCDGAFAPSLFGPTSEHEKEEILQIGPLTSIT